MRRSALCTGGVCRARCSNSSGGQDGLAATRGPCAATMVTLAADGTVHLFEDGRPVVNVAVIDHAVTREKDTKAVANVLKHIGASVEASQVPISLLILESAPNATAFRCPSERLCTPVACYGPSAAAAPWWRSSRSRHSRLRAWNAWPARYAGSSMGRTLIERLPCELNLPYSGRKPLPLSSMWGVPGHTVMCLPATTAGPCNMTMRPAITP
jgi:hypothetical protein